MKERPILFSGPMVRAILEGRKTQTRRAVKTDLVSYNLATCEEGPLDARQIKNQVKCPYGKPGDRLWVRENWYYYDKYESRNFCETRKIPYSPDGVMPGAEGFHLRRIRYEATEGNPDPVSPWRIRPSIHMPRWASRITLEITGLRVERLNDISEADAVAEGVRYMGEGEGYEDYCLGPGTWCTSAKASFASLWVSINGSDSLSANPWVWVLEFKRLEAA